MSIDIVTAAEKIARAAHAGQVDKAGRPYIEHPARVAAACSSPKAKAVAWLHDVVEDTHFTLEGLADAGMPDDVVAGVDAITRRRWESDDMYYERVRANALALEAKDEDTRDNGDRARLAALPADTRSRLITKYTHARQELGLPPLHDPVGEYSAAFSARHADAAVHSPVGSWLLLAATGLLGDDAQDHAAVMLAHVPDAVKTAAAAWGTPQMLAALRVRPDLFTLGPVPTQAEADQWTSDKTDRLICRFPLDMPTDPRDVVFVTVVAAKTAWETRLDVIPALRLGGPLGEGLSQCVRVDTRLDLMRVVTHPEGTFVVLSMTGTNGLTVHSVLGPPDLPSETVRAAAREIVTGAHAPALSLDEIAAAAIDGVDVSPASEDSAVALLPCWDHTGKIDLARDPEYVAAKASPAVQVARAKFDPDGFEAAAVTAMVVRAAMPRHTGRRVTARYNRPYAVVATVADGSPWAGLPLFEAWVTEAVEPPTQ